MGTKLDQYCTAITRAVECGEVKNKLQLDRLKLRIGKQLGMQNIPTNPDILARSGVRSKALAELLSIKPLRTLSGVAPVAIMTKPANCPHGTCIYCPGGPNSPFGSVPQSYTGHEPATMRGISNNYDPYLQTMNRIQQYYATGHNPEKLELIIMGGTFPSMPLEYQEEFVSGAFSAANDFSRLFFMEGIFDHRGFNEFFSMQHAASQEIAGKLLALRKKQDDAESAHLENETAKVRIVTMCIETKPDWSKESHINQMLRLGATRVELGAQTVYGEILKYTNRGHTLEDTIEATRLLKDSGLKVAYHMMPGQPLSTREKDIEMFRELFDNPDYRPDALKIYPCMVMPGTALAKLYEHKRFTPLSTEEAADIIVEAYRSIPEYVRVHRVQRDIPTKLALTGIDKNNLRQIVEKKMHEKGIQARDIRARESGINSLIGKEVDYSNVQLVERKYDASKGKEAFISFEDKTNDLILGFCRLRKPHSPFRPEFTSSATACVRELHVFGAQMGLGKHSEESQQHRGFGAQLMKRAEELARNEFGADKMLVISGVGAREYYARKLGYERDGAYMGKAL